MPRSFPDVEVADCEGAACYLQKLKQFTAQMCACRPGNKSCADKINEAMSTWGQAQAQLVREPGNGQPDPLSEIDARALSAIMARYAECMMKANMPVQ